MEFENIDSPKPMPIYDRNTRLAEMNAFVWFVGFGVGGATGLAFFYALFAVWSGASSWIAITATTIATIHASIIVAFWRYRDVVRRRTALMVSMIASAILTCSLAWMIGSNGLQTTPLYGLAWMHLLMAFCHPVLFNTTKTTE